jgi:hypothetical protein
MFCYKRIFLIELVGSLFFLFFHSAEAEPLGFDFFSSPGRVSHYTFLVGLAQVYSKELVIEQTGQPVNHAPKSRAYYPFDQPIIGPVLMIDGEHFASPEKRWGFNWSVMPLYYRVQAGTYRLVDENDVLYVQSPASDLFLFFVGAGPVVHYPRRFRSRTERWIINTEVLMVLKGRLFRGAMPFRLAIRWVFR